MEQKYHLYDNDFIPTISDSDDDVPDFDGLENGVEFGNISRREAAAKRKRAEKKAVTNKRRKVEPDDNDYRSEATPQANVADLEEEDAGLNSDFDFMTDAQEGVVIDGWNLEQAGGDKMRKVIGVDEIVERRKLAQGLQKNHMDILSVDGNPDVTQESEDDELLAEDGFGMGAIASDQEDESASDDRGDGVHEDDSHEKDQEGPDEIDTGDEDQDEDDHAAPMPHPDDFIVDLEDSISDEETPTERAKRNAFFAPEVDEGDSEQLAKPAMSFQNMSLSRPILKGVAAVGFAQPTPIQSKTVPVALLGKDVVGGAVTGSGKTAAFIIPILERLLYRPKKVATTRVGILMPTRELAVQCFNVANKLASFTDITFALIVGGLSLREQEQTLKRRPDVVIATPGRFIDHMRNTASFVVENIEILVLDEADRMLEDGFADELNEVITTIPRKRQTMLFSATMTDDVDKLVRIGMTQPVRLLVDAKKQTVAGLTQEFIKLKVAKNTLSSAQGESKDESHRLAYLLYLVLHIYTAKTIVFFPTKALAHRVKVVFALNGLRAAELHGSMSQEQRLTAIASFRDGNATHLLATDLASRGLDIPRVETVINYTVPSQTATYLHRVGRTARAGRTGVACTLFASTKEGKSVKNKSASERALLKPIMRVAKGQKAIIRTRTLPGDAITQMLDQTLRQRNEIEQVLEEEKEERLIAQTERDVVKSENMIKFGEEIAARPRRTWFQTEKEKVASKETGRDERVGTDSSSLTKKPKLGKLSNKQRKALDTRDQRKLSGGGWKKGKDERAGKGVLKGTAGHRRDKNKKKG